VSGRVARLIWDDAVAVLGQLQAAANLGYTLATRRGLQIALVARRSTQGGARIRQHTGDDPDDPGICGGKCGRKPGFCAHRVLTRPAADETKSRAGRRVIGIPEALLGILREHHAEQAHERERAGQLWQVGGWVFTAPTGAPINPNADYHEWKRLLLAAGLRDGRLHDARHTAATVLLLLGVPERAVMGLMGWSTTAMAARYQHITDPIRRDVAARVGGLIWAEPNGPGAAVDQAN